MVLRPLREADAESIAAAFSAIGWDKPAAQYRRYFEEQQVGLRSALVAEEKGRFAGYLTIIWAAHYPPFRDDSIPEIVDLNVLPDFRRKGIATALLDEAERRISERSPVAGIGVGLTLDYGPAQRLYVQRGYVPDGRGITTLGDRVVGYGEIVRADDDLVLHLTKRLRTD